MIKNARLVTHTPTTNEKKYEGFGGRPPVGGRTGPGPPAPPPLNPALTVTMQSYACAALSINLSLIALAGMIKQSVASVRPSVCLFSLYLLNRLTPVRELL